MFMKSGRKKLQEEEFIQNLVPNPLQTPDVQLLGGYLGKSSQAGYWRLYLNPELTSYVDIAEKDIIYSQLANNNQNSLGGTLLWVRRGAEIKATRTTSRESQADFLRGAIAASMARMGAAGVLGSIAAQPRTFNVSECIHCTTDGGDSCFSPLCSLTGGTCRTLIPTDPGCGGKLGGVFGGF
jgi:hypothetical protein